MVKNWKIEYRFKLNFYLFRDPVYCHTSTVLHAVDFGLGEMQIKHGVYMKDFRSYILGKAVAAASFGI